MALMASVANDLFFRSSAAVISVKRISSFALLPTNFDLICLYLSFIFKLGSPCKSRAGTGLGSIQYFTAFCPVSFI